MPYNARPTRANPSCLLFLIDQSGSMGDQWGEDGAMNKADEVADIVNRFLQDLSIKCAREEGVRDYYHVGCIGYGSNSGPALSGILAGRDIVTLSELANGPARIEERSKKISDGTGGFIETTVRFPIWLDPVASGGTPMCHALATARSILQNWLSQHEDCFPPIVINVTDGESTDGDPRSAAQGLMELGSSDGNVLLFNAHVSSRRGDQAFFPASEVGLVDDYARLLFELSCAVPDRLYTLAAAAGYELQPGARGFAFNAKMEQLIKFVEIGTGTAAANELR